MNNFADITIFALHYKFYTYYNFCTVFFCVPAGWRLTGLHSVTQPGEVGHFWRYSQALAEGEYFLKACLYPWAKLAQQEQHLATAPVGLTPLSATPNTTWPTEHPQSRAGRGQSSLSLCLEKVLLHWVTPSYYTFFHGFIASFQSD